MNIWQKLKKPIFALAPMEDVTDTVFRQIVAKYARPDVFFTEFTSSDTICSEGLYDGLKRLVYTENERPIVAQIWGVTPEHYYESSKQIAQMGFDGIDINMGCPVRDIIKKGACSALIKNKPLAKEIIQAVKEGIHHGCHPELVLRYTQDPELAEWVSGSRLNKMLKRVQHDNKKKNSECKKCIPVSVKTRIGFAEIQTEEWVGFLLEQKIDCLMIHGRTVREMSKFPVHWDEIGKAVRLRNKMGITTPILGNGDILSYEEGLEKIKTYGLNGIMIGRGVFQNLFVFDQNKDFRTLPINKKLEVLQEHIDLYENTWKGKKSYNVLKKYFKMYVSGFDGASDMRGKLMETKSPGEARKIIKEIHNDLSSRA